ncbi:MAG: glycosyltransferase [Candidatus Omnitrophota bacterium]
MSEDKIELSVVMPCLNEEKGLGICIRKILEVFARENIHGEIVVCDNGSRDRSVEIARAAGAHVVIEPQPGYGAAYLRGLREAKGDYIIIGDSDNTYDFSAIMRFLKPLRSGVDFVIGSRFKGTIHKGAMPWANRYIGNPILSGMTRLFFHTSLSDIHSGMRGFSRAAYHKMKLHTCGMEFATEMVVAAITNDLTIQEVPIDYFMRRGSSKLNAFFDAWRHVRFMFMYCPVWLYFVPGVLGFAAGMLLLFLLVGGPFLFLGHYWDIHVLVLGSMVSILSYQLLHMGIYAHMFAVSQGFLKEDRLVLFFEHYFNLEKWLLAGFVFFAVGVGINFFILAEWFSHDFGALYRIRESILSTTLLVIGLQTMFSSFFISLLLLKKK